MYMLVSRQITLKVAKTIKMSVSVSYSTLRPMTIKSLVS